MLTIKSAMFLTGSSDGRISSGKLADTSTQKKISFEPHFDSYLALAKVELPSQKALWNHGLHFKIGEVRELPLSSD